MLRKDRQYLDAISAIEIASARFAFGATLPLAEAVQATCSVLRQSLATHRAGSTAGEVIRKFVPERLAELEEVCRSTHVEVASSGLRLVRTE